MDYQHIRLTQEAGIVTLSFNRPETRNAMSPAMGDEIVHAVQQLRVDPSLRVFILTGTGKAFSSGGDLSMIARGTGANADRGAPGTLGSLREFYARYLAIRSLPVPTIAAINGHAIGAGLCIALACDLRVAVADAQMGMTFTKLGIHPGMGATYFLPRLTGTARACELFFTGRIFDAAAAERFGIVNRIAPRAEFDACVQSLAREIAASGPLAVRMVKQSIYRGAHHSLDEMLDYEALQQGITLTTEDAREGIMAIMEKRQPRFVGK